MADRISSLLLAWYDLHARMLPWRGIHDPYRTWVSETMLQQTRVETVLGYYERFLTRFPALADLADAPEADVQDNAGEDLPVDDGGSLFGGFGEVEPALAKPRSVKTVNDANSSRVHKTIGESHTGTRAWLTDMPGPEVKDIRSAISLNDRVMFISSLFREDSMLFQDVVSKINAQTSIDKVVSYLEETFPEWNMDSELVYRFMMAVRRKIR